MFCVDVNTALVMGIEAHRIDVTGALINGY